jgi:outer membrane protein assembly factor BamB
VQVYPGFWGGIETPGAFAEGTLYYQVDDLPTPYTATAWDAKDGQTSVENLEGRTVYARGTSSLIALDAGTGRIRWQHRFGTVGFGAATVVNDLVFTSTYDGMVYALRRRDGREVWRWQAPGGINAWPAVSGDTIVLPVGLGLRPQLIALRVGAKERATIGRARPEHSPR